MQQSFRRIAAFPLILFSIAALSLSAVGFSAAGSSAFAQSSAQDRIVQPIADSKRIALVGNVTPLASAKYDLGAAPVSQPMNHVEFVLQRSAAQEAALENFLASVQQKGSPNYHKWLTPDQFGKLYGPSDGDIAKLTAWLAGKGFTVNNIAPGRTHIDFSGTVGQVQTAFGTSIHSFNASGVQFLANTTNPQIPAAFSAVVVGVFHLNTVPLKPMHVKGFAAKYDPAAKRIVPIGGQRRLRPNLTEQDESGNNYLVAVPADMATIYDTPNSKYNANASGSATYDGTGAIIGIAGQSSIQTSIVANYRTLFIGDSKIPTVFNPDNVGDVSGDDSESYLDNEIAGSMAPGASIYFYTEPAADGGVFYAAQEAIEANAVDILSVSYGDCESDQGNAANAAINSSWQQAAAQGITVLVATGDTGSAGCDFSTDSEGNSVTSASGGTAVNGLGSTPYNVAVGGTDYDILSTNFGGYVSTPSNGGSATTFYRTAMKYIPEDTWNDSPITNGTVAENVPLASNEEYAADANISAGAGGKSSCAVQIGNGSDGGYLPPSSCSSGYAKPSWQSGTGVPNDAVRDLPDVSLLSGDGDYNALWAVCDNSSDEDGGTLDCAPGTNGDFENDAFGGTSASTPAYASIFALVRQKTGDRLGQAAEMLYSLFNGSSSSLIFHDVTTGNNSVPCTQSTTNASSCVADTAGYFFEAGYDTTVGYDLATGLGSVDVTQLINAWGSSSAPITPIVTVTASTTEIAVSEPLSFAVSVAGPAGSATPTGSVTLSVGTYISTATPLASGSATITVPANTLTPGAYTASVAYTPDSDSSGTYFAGSGTVAIIVGGSFSLNTPAAVTVTAGDTTGNTTTATASTANGYTGTITFTCTLSTEPTGANASYYPACTPGGTVTLTSSQTTGSTTIAFATTARSTTTATAVPSERPGSSGWYIPVGGAALAGILFFGIPARRRSWRGLLSLLVFLVAMGGAGCGGGGGGSSSSPPVTIGTTAGQYTFTLTGTDANSVSATTTLTLNVN